MGGSTPPPEMEKLSLVFPWKGHRPPLVVVLIVLPPLVWEKDLEEEEEGVIVSPLEFSWTLPL